MSAIFLSDVHLTDSTSVKAKVLVRFFQQIASSFDEIYILGDLFDVWPGTSGYFVRLYGPIIQALKRLVEGGSKVYYLEGNHDFRLGSFFSKKLGIGVYEDFIIQNWAGKRILMMHGDFGSSTSFKSRAFRKFLRLELVHKIKALFPQEWVFRFGMNVSRLSRYRQRNYRKKEALIRQTYRKIAEASFAQGYDVVIMGHSHLPDDVTVSVNGRDCRYINIGDWVNHFTYLEFDGSQFYTKTHPLTDT